MITFVDTLKENVLDPLEKLIREEYSLAIHYDRDFTIRGTSWFNLLPISDVLIDRRSGSEIRDFTITIQYIRATSGDFQRNTHINTVTPTIERLKRLLSNNSDYSPSSAYKWHDGRCSSISYGESLSPDFVLIEATFVCSVEEVFT
tara:strand:- start:2182 stop:2619 length:438 start_codon:yes stop_codon:yes gene_type:complete